MNLKCSLFVSLVACVALSCTAFAQSPGVLYTWDGTGDVQQWKKNFGTNDVLLDNNIAGQLRIVEIGSPGSDVALTDNANKRLESSTATGGLDLTGLEYLEFDLGHSGAGDIDVQFYIQGSTSYTYKALGPDLAVAPGVSTYQVPLSGLTFEQQVYIRTVGFSVRDHAAEGNVTWTLEEVRSAGTPLTVRDLATHDVGSSDNGLQGAFANFTLDAIAGNDGGQNQTGLSQNAVTGSLEWVDLGDHGVDDPSGAAIAYGNGTVFNGSSFNERLTDLSNYDFVTYRMSATDVSTGGGSVDVQAYFQTGSGYSYQDAGILSLPIDGSFYELTFPLSGVSDRTNVQFSGVNLASHTNDITMNIDLVRYSMVPEPGAIALVSIAACCAIMRRRVR